MTTLDHVPAARARERVTQANVIRSEWTKLWSLRSTRWSLLAAVIAQGLLWAKIAVFSAVTFVLMLISTIVSFFAVQAIVTQHHVQHSISDPHARVGGVVEVVRKGTGPLAAKVPEITVLSRVLKLNPILSFWLAYILTRPHGGLGLGTTGTSYIFLDCILALVAFLTITKRARTPPAAS